MYSSAARDGHQLHLLPPRLPLLELDGQHCIAAPGSEVSVHVKRYGEKWFGAIHQRDSEIIVSREPHQCRASALLWIIGEVVDRGLFTLPEQFDHDLREIWVVDHWNRKEVVIRQPGQDNYVVFGAYKLHRLSERNRCLWRGQCDGYSSYPFASDVPEEALLFCLLHWIDETRWR